jgi:hypothetical protein
MQFFREMLSSDAKISSKRFVGFFASVLIDFTRKAKA